MEFALVAHAGTFIPIKDICFCNFGVAFFDERFFHRVLNIFDGWNLAFWQGCLQILDYIIGQVFSHLAVAPSYRYCGTVDGI